MRTDQRYQEGQFTVSRFRAMGCACQIVGVTGDDPEASVRLASAEALVRVVEKTLSRFDPESELSRLNNRAGQWVQVSPLLWSALDHALSSARATHGIYDPTVLGALKAWGYNRSFEEVQATPIWVEEVSSPPGRWQDVRTDPATRSVFLPPGVGIDLGGIAKGWTADILCHALADMGPVLADLGGDICALGVPPGHKAWPVAVANPFQPEADVALLAVANAGVATSGVDFRRWATPKGLAHHIIDPRTGKPAETDVFTATVVAPSGLQADLFALVCVLLGTEQALAMLSRMEGMEGLLITKDGRILWSRGLERYLIEVYGTKGGGA
ncbi:FAD:protein FMN transferase [bacterium HR23]|nr:FAD:protein FMN transferase [bacterium HR23]